MSTASMRILVKKLPETNPKTKTKPVWRKPVVEYPKDATIIDIPYKWVPEKEHKPKKKIEKPKPKPVKKPKKQKPLGYQGTGREEWTEEQVETLIRLYNEGVSYLEITEAVKHGENSVGSKLLRLRKEGRLGEKRTSGDAWNEQDLETLVRMRSEGATFEQIAQAVERSPMGTWSRYQKLKRERE